MRITANIVEVATGAVKRTVKVDGRIDDIFALQDKIVFELSQGLNVALRGTEIADIERRETRSVGAYESYARGVMNLRQATRDSIDRAIAAFEDATRQDPEYALAWAALGGAYGLKGSFLSIPEMAHQAMDMERRALALDPQLADARSWLGTSLLALGRTDEAIVEIREALRLDPDSGQAHQALARAYWVGKGDFAAAIPLFERAIALNPEAGYSYLQLSLLLAWDGQLERAEEICRRAVELQEQYISGNFGLQIVGAHARLGLRALPVGEVRRGAARIRARAGVHRVERSRAAGPHAPRAQRRRSGRRTSARAAVRTRSGTSAARSRASTPASRPERTTRSPGITSPACTRCAATRRARSSRSNASRPACRRSPPPARAWTSISSR